MKKMKSDGEKEKRVSSHSAHRKKSNKDDGWLSKESTQREIRSRRSIDNRPESLPDTVPDSTVAGSSIAIKKKKSETPLRSVENVKSAENEKEKPSNLPDPLSALMLERDESVRREKEKEKEREGRKRKEDEERRGFNKPTKLRKPSLFAKKKRPSFEPTVPSPLATVPSPLTTVHSPLATVPSPTNIEPRITIPGMSTVARRLGAVSSVERMMESGDLRRRATIGSKDKGRSGDGGEKIGIGRRKSMEDGGDSNWIAPSLHDFRPSNRQSRKSEEGTKSNDSPLYVRRESTGIVPATPTGSVKGVGERRVSLESTKLDSPSAADFTPLNGRKKRGIMSVFGEKKEEDKEGEKEKEKEKEEEQAKVKPKTQLSYGRLASAIYRKTSVRSEVSIGSTVPGEFEEEEVDEERQIERMNSIASLASMTNEKPLKRPVVDRFLSSISLATTRGPSSTGSVVKDSMEEEENDGFKALINDDSEPEEFEIKDTVQEGAPKAIIFTKPSGLGLFRRPAVATAAPLSSPLPTRHASSGSSANPRGRRQIGAVFEDKLCKQLETALCVERSHRSLLKLDASSATSKLLTVNQDRTSCWGVNLFSSSRGELVVLSGNVAPPSGTNLRLALPLERVLGTIIVSPTVL
ncbi:hypothetical protein PFISCL1PPCAC_19229 [Pristionchus fissidentatus]|uniref:Uncharacterized protein n=1 Tax=Pristionchus fissidentatus TaxID=1538716 RepID=A0AAV5WAB6_9BILA|nr:hypothetical protein PFISCL1PPCAC_19229 [Pristionchus fissidentatus]